jgi:hypothetical protein
MKTFRAYYKSIDDIDTIVESIQRTASTVAIYAYMKRQTAKIKREKNLPKKVDLLANLINASAAASFAFSQYPSTEKG